MFRAPLPRALEDEAIRKDREASLSQGLGVNVAGHDFLQHIKPRQEAESEQGCPDDENDEATQLSIFIFISIVPRAPSHLALTAPLPHDIFNPARRVLLQLSTVTYDLDPQAGRRLEPAREGRAGKQIHAVLVDAGQDGNHAKAPGDGCAVHGQADEEGRQRQHGLDGQDHVQPSLGLQGRDLLQERVVQGVRLVERPSFIIRRLCLGDHVVVLPQSAGLVGGRGIAGPVRFDGPAHLHGQEP